jgi:Ser/Thr protein kinase RdoA (MazF antagonist)
MAEFQYRAVLQHWHKVIGQVVAWENTHHKDTVFKITADTGKTWILKKVLHLPTHDRLISEYNVLRYLHDHDVPVSVPLLTDSGDVFVEFNEQIFTLSPALPTNSSTVKANDRQRYKGIGRALGHFHHLLGTYPDPIESWTMNISDKLENEIFPYLEETLNPGNFSLFQQQLKSIKSQLIANWQQLPTQYIHGDFHGGNILFDGNKVTGFIDLDHLPIGTRIYDISYFLADEVKNRIDDSKKLESWLASFIYLIYGYTHEICLSTQEQDKLWHGMLFTQLMFIDWFVKSKNEEHIEKNTRVFNWIYTHQTDIHTILNQSN